MPMNLPVDRMRPKPVAECVKTFMPKVVYLNHYDQPHARWLSNQQEPFPHGVQDTATTINNFIDALEGNSIEFSSNGHSLMGSVATSILTHSFLNIVRRCPGKSAEYRFF